MDKITYNDKAQASAYDASKFNAHDANEIKSTINGNVDDFEAFQEEVRGIMYVTKPTSEETLGYSVFTDTSSGAVDNLWINKNSASTKVATVKTLRAKLLGTGQFSLVHMRINGSKYTKVNSYVLTSTNNNSVIQEFDLRSLNIAVQVGDVFGLIAYTGSGARPRYNSASTGHSYTQVASSVANFEFNVSSYTSTGVSNIAYCFDVITESGDVTDLKSEVFDLRESLQEVSDNITNLDAKPRFILPPVIYAVVGFDLTIFYNAIGLSFDFGDDLGYRVMTDCPIGKGYGTFYRVNPTSAGDYTLVFRAYTYAKKLIAEKTVTLRAVSATTVSSLKNLLFIGDSVTEGGATANQVLTNIQTIGGTKPKLWGTTKPNTDSANEGHGGWKYSSFSTAGTTYYRVNVTAIAGSISSNARYSTNGSIFTVVEQNLTEGTGYLSLSRYSGSTIPEVNGVLTLNTGTGPSTINFTGMEIQPANPLWNLATNAIDIANYKYNILGMPAASYFDVVNIQLGINDMLGGSLNKTDAEINAVLDHAQTVIDAFLADNAATKVVIQVSPFCNSTGGGFNSEEGYKSYLMNMHRCAELTISRFTGYNARLFVGFAAMSLHRLFGYNSTDIAIFPGQTVKINTNNVHPNAEGYKQIGHGAFPVIYSLIK